MRHIKGIEQFKCIPPFSKKDNHPAFLTNDYLYVTGDKADQYPMDLYKDDLFEIRCSNGDCKMSIKLSGDKATSILENIKKTGCPVCNNKDFQLFKLETRKV